MPSDGLPGSETSPPSEPPFSSSNEPAPRILSGEKVLGRDRREDTLLPLPAFPRNATPYLFDDGDQSGPSMVDFEVQVERNAHRLRQLEIERLLWVSDNSARWPIVELAALRAGVVFIPLSVDAPATLIESTAALTGADAILAEEPDAIASLFETSDPLPAIEGVEGWRITPRTPAVELPSAAARITMTRGITGAPRGVVHSAEQLWENARRLHRALATGRHDVHLALLPLARLAPLAWTVLGPLISGGHAVLPPLAPLGLRPGRTTRPTEIARVIEAAGPTTLLVTPRVLRAWFDALPAHAPTVPSRLRRIVSIGATLPRDLSRRARDLDLPLYEGYGLVECCGVIAMNTPREQIDHTIGRPLPSIDARIASDGEVWIRGSSPLGILDAHGYTPAGIEVPTGDVGTIDPEGSLSILGRKKNVIETAQGRRVHPEWIEETLEQQTAIARAFVFGKEGVPTPERLASDRPELGSSDLPDLRAVILPRAGYESEVERAIERVNLRLPASTRIRGWVTIDEPLSCERGTLTASGHPDRDAIIARCRALVP